MSENNRLDAVESVPVTLLTGFLGSGKTTLLSCLLAHSDMEETAVLINEFGEIGLDHLLVREVSENIVMLNSGCLCCTVRGDLPDSLRELFVMRAKGDIPAFRRAFVAHRPPRVLQQQRRLPRIGQQPLARRGQAHASRPALEQLLAEPVLEPLDPGVQLERPRAARPRLADHHE